MQENFHRKKHLTSFQMIILGFAGVILLGTLLLMLPVSSADGIVTPFDEALFTSTSAVCVTGLVVQMAMYKFFHRLRLPLQGMREEYPFSDHLYSRKKGLPTFLLP